MGLHAIPRCFKCRQGVEADRVYAAPCDHDDCPSAIFHPICLMEWREFRDAHMQHLREFISTHMRVMRPNPEES